MKRGHLLIVVLLILALLPTGVIAQDGITQTSSSPQAFQPGEARINLQSILHITTTDTVLSIEQALNELGYAYDLFSGSDWTGIDFAPYDIVIIGMDGGTMTDASVQKIRTDVIDQGKRAIFIGGTCWQEFAIAVDSYLVLNDFNDYCWSTSSTPHWTVVDPGHGLAAGLPGTYDFANTSAAYYATRATDPDLEVVAVNGDGYDQFFYKGANFPMLDGNPSNGGDLIWFIDSPYSAYWADPGDFAVLKQIIDNSINYGAGEMTMHVEAIAKVPAGGRALAKVLVADQNGTPLATVMVDATVSTPLFEWARWRYTNLGGWARFWTPLMVGGTYEVCVDNLALDGYVYEPGDNVITCLAWDWSP